jgi:Insertion element 4 transposase N-terminal
MARTAATLGEEARITDYISLGVITSAFPEKAIRTAVAETGRSSVRERELPAHVVVYYVIAQALLMRVSPREVLRCLREGVRWLCGPQVALKVSGKSGISQARSRLGWEPVKQLHDAVVAPIAVKQTRGAWYKNWRLVSLDGSTLEVADTEENRAAFGRPGASRGRSAYPQIRFVSLVEHGTHVLFGTAMAGYATGEISLAKSTLKRLQPGMLCLADRNFLGRSSPCSG